MIKKKLNVSRQCKKKQFAYADALNCTKYDAVKAQSSRPIPFIYFFNGSDLESLHGLNTSGGYRRGSHILVKSSHLIHSLTINYNFGSLLEFFEQSVSKQKQKKTILMF